TAGIAAGGADRAGIAATGGGCDGAGSAPAAGSVLLTGGRGADFFGALADAGTCAAGCTGLLGAGLVAGAAPARTGMSGDRRRASCGLDADTSFAVGIIFCPVSGDESDFTGTPVID